jgi:hypothetical protein
MNSPSSPTSDAPVVGVVAGAVPPQFRLGADSWSRAPLRLLSLGHCASEALSSVAAPPPAAAPAAAPAAPGARAASAASAALPWALRPALSGLTMVYIACASWDRSRRAAQFQLAPAARAYLGKRAAVESLAREWLACVTLPSLAAAALLAGARAALVARGAPAGGAALRWGPAALVLTLSPALLAGAAPLADALVMDWAVRPALDAIMPPPGAAASGAVMLPEDLAPTPPPPAAAGASTPAPPPTPADAALLLGLGAPAADPLTREQLAWALDGRTDTRFPGADVPTLK